MVADTLKLIPRESQTLGGGVRHRGRTIVAGGCF
jgi:hypothetical protein